MRETRHRPSKPSSVFGLRCWLLEMLVPLRGSGSKALLDMLNVNKEGSQSALNCHAKMPHGLNAASTNARRLVAQSQAHFRGNGTSERGVRWLRNQVSLGSNGLKTWCCFGNQMRHSDALANTADSHALTYYY